MSEKLSTAEAIEKLSALLEEIKGRSLTKDEIEILTNQEIEVLRQLIGSFEALRTLADLQSRNPSAFEAWVRVYNLGVGAARLGGLIAFIASGIRRILVWIVATVAMVIAVKNGGFGMSDLFKYLGLMK